MTNSFQPTTRAPLLLINEEMNNELESFNEDFELEPVETRSPNAEVENARQVVQRPPPAFGRQVSETQHHINGILDHLLDRPTTSALAEEIFRPAEADENLDEMKPTIYTHLNPEIVYPTHVLRANGISFLSSDGKLFATNRGKDNKHMFFGLDHFDKTANGSDYAEAELLVYLSAAGKHGKIVGCAACAEKYNSTEFMEVSFMSKRQTREVELPGGGFGILCPIVDNIGEDNNRTYQIKFNCFTSHLKAQKSDQVRLNFAIIMPNGMIIWDHKVTVEVTANPGRDSGVFVPMAGRPTKRPSITKTEPGVPIKRARAIPVKTERSDFLSPAAMDLIRSKIPPETSAEVTHRLYSKMQRRIENMINMEMELFCEEQNATG